MADIDTRPDAADEGRRARRRLRPAGFSARRPLFAMPRRVATGIAATQASLAPLRDLDEIFGEAPPRAVRYTPYVVVAVIVAVTAVASIVRTDIIVTAGGKLTTDTPPIVLQPLQLAVIRDLRVRPGDVVHKGDTLATLDATFSQADRTTLVSQRDAVAAEIDRLEAELNGTPLSATATNPDRVLQYTLYGQRQSQYSSRLRAFDEDIQRVRDLITGTAANDISLGQQVDAYKQVEEMHAKLFASKIEAKVTYLDAQIGRMRTERDKRDSEMKLDEQRHDLLARQAERQVFIDQWRSQLLDDLVKARKEAKSVGEGLVKADRVNDLVALRSPEDGIVLDVAKRSVGSVMQAAEPLITIVPSGAPLIADVMISSADVGYVKIGDPVVIKVDAYPFQRYGVLEGRLRSVGEDSTNAAGSTQPAGSPTHRSQVELTQTTLTDGPPDTRLIPGMTLTAEVKTGSRRVISYFLEPITRGLKESLREP